MSNGIHEHLRSNVVGYVAIFLFAIGGTAYATHPGGANTISSVDILNGEVKAADIGTGELTSGDILNGTIDQQDLANGAVGGANLITGSVSSPKVANDSLTNLDIANTNSLGSAEIGGLTGGDITDGGLTGADVADTDSLGSPEVGGLSGGDVTDGSLTGDDITDGSVKNADLEPVESVTHPMLGACDGATNWTSPSALARQVGFWKDRSGVVHLQGSVGCAGNATEGSAIFTLPAGYQPTSAFGVVRWPALAGGASIAQIAVLDDFSGAVVYDGPDSAAADDYISLEGLTFRP